MSTNDAILLKIPGRVVRVMQRGADAEILSAKGNVDPENTGIDGAKRMLHVFDETERRIRVVLHRQKGATGVHSDVAYLEKLAEARHVLTGDKFLSTLLHPADPDVWPALGDLENLVRMRSAVADTSRPARSDESRAMPLWEAFCTLKEDFHASGVFPLTEAALASSSASSGAAGAATQTKLYSIQKHPDIGDCRAACAGDPDKSAATRWFETAGPELEVLQSKFGGDLPAHFVAAHAAHASVTSLSDRSNVKAIFTGEPEPAALVDRWHLKLRPVHEHKLQSLGMPTLAEIISARGVVTLADLCDWRNGWAVAPRVAADMLHARAATHRIRVSHGVNLTVWDAPQDIWVLTIRPLRTDVPRDAAWWSHGNTTTEPKGAHDPLIQAPPPVATAFNRHSRAQLNEALESGRARWDGLQRGPMTGRVPTAPPAVFYKDEIVEVVATKYSYARGDDPVRLLVLHGCKTTVGLPVPAKLEQDLASAVPDLAAMETAVATGRLAKSAAIVATEPTSVTVTTTTTAPQREEPITQESALRRLRDLFASNGGTLTKSQIESDTELRKLSDSMRTKLLKSMADFSRGKDGGWKLTQQ